MEGKEDKKVLTFPKGISPKVNVIVWLDFEPTSYDVVVQHVSFYTPETPTERKSIKKKRRKNEYKVKERKKGRKKKERKRKYDERKRKKFKEINMVERR